MIKHIVCFKLENPTAELLAKTKDILLSMEGKVPEVCSVEVGLDLLHSPRSYDVILQVVVDDLTALDSYQKDPYHCDVVKTHMHAVASSSIALDYEI